MHSNTVIVLQLHETKRQGPAKREKEERESERERQSYHGKGEKQDERRERGGLDNVIPPSRETAQSVKMREPRGAEEGTARGEAIIRHQRMKVLYRVKTGSRTNPHCKSICKLWMQDVGGKNKHCSFDSVCIFRCDTHFQ